MFLASFPPVRGLVFQAAPLGACRGSREVGVLLAQAASVRLRRHQVFRCPASVALDRRPLHARCAVLHDLDTAVSGQFCRGHWPIAQARLRLHVLSSSRHRGLQKSRCTAGRYASAARAFISPTAFEQARGGALGAGGGRVGFAGGGLFRVQAPLLSRPRGAYFIRLRGCGC